MFDEENKLRAPLRNLTEPELSDTELRELRDLLEADRRLKWFWKRLRTWAIWAGAVTGGLMVAWDGFVKLIAAAGGG